MFSLHFKCHLQRGEEHLAGQLLPGPPAAQSPGPSLRPPRLILQGHAHSLCLLLRANNQVSHQPPRASGPSESHSQVCSLSATMQRRGTQGGARHPPSVLQGGGPRWGSECSTDRGPHTKATASCGGHLSRQKQQTSW